MQRELKFRAWDGEKLHDVMSLLGTNFCKVPKKAYPYSEEIVVKEVLQYTGINDSEGTEIYEGDILENKRGRKTDVKYDLDYAGFVIKRRSIRHNNYELIDCLLEFLDEKVKVIGNVFENKELLSNEQK